MEHSPQAPPFDRSVLAWLSVSLFGAAAPALALVLLADTTARDALAQVTAPILAIGLMGSAMIGAAITRQLWIGVALALLTGAGLILLAKVLGAPKLPHPISTSVVLVIASVSFAARGALFARSAGYMGWWIAVAVVGGEAAIVATSAAMPGSLPDWLLALLPAQWATAAIQNTLTGSGALVANSFLLALGGTAATTLLVYALWPRRWPYLLMFSAWLGLSILVYHSSALTMPHAGLGGIEAGLPKDPEEIVAARQSAIRPCGNASWGKA